MTKSDFQTQLKSLTPAQQDFVLSQLINKIYQNPADYGLSAGGVLKVGDKFIFSKLFEDEEEIETLFKKSRDTITPGSEREKNIIVNKKKITDWVREHPEGRPTNDKIAEIINIKSEEGIVKEPTISLPDHAIEQERLENTHQEIAEAKQRISELENQRNPNLERTLVSDSKVAANQIETNFAVNEIFENGIDNIYGKRGVFGLGRVRGLDTPEWKAMSKINADDALRYFKGEAERQTLSPNIIQALESPQNQAFIQEMKHLADQAEVVTPRQKELSEGFMKRLLEFVTIRKPRLEQNLPKIA